MGLTNNCGGSGAVKRAGLKMNYPYNFFDKKSRGLVPSGVRILPPAKLFFERKVLSKEVFCFAKKRSDAA